MYHDTFREAKTSIGYAMVDVHGDVHGHLMDGLTDCSMYTPSGVSTVAPWHVSWTVDRISDPRAHKSTHDRSARHGQGNGINPYP